LTAAFRFTAAVVRGGVLTTGGAARAGALLGATVGVGVAVGVAVADGVGVALTADELLETGREPPLPQPAIPVIAANRNAAPIPLMSAVGDFFMSYPLC
jgi:hypothetical protein